MYYRTFKNSTVLIVVLTVASLSSIGRAVELKRPSLVSARLQISTRLKLSRQNAVSKAENSKRLLEAVQQQDVAAVQALLAKGASANSIDERKRSALMLAVSHANIEIARMLIRQKANINYCTAAGIDALNVAIIEGGVCWTDSSGPDETAFIRIAKWLVDQGADIRSVRRSEPNLLILSYYSLKHWAELCEYLVQHGATTTGKDEAGQSILNYAVRSGTEKLIGLLLKQNVSRQEKNRLLLYALAGRPERYYNVAVEPGFRPKKETVRALLEGGADPNICDRNGYSALQLSVYNQDYATLMLLLAAGANVNYKRPVDGTTALSTAQWRNADDLAQLLIDAGAKE